MRFRSVVKQFALTGVLGLTLPIGANAADLKDIYDLAVQNDPQLAAAKATFMAQKEAVPQARAGLLPNVSARLSTTQNDQTSPTFTKDYQVTSLQQQFNTHRWSATLTQPVFNLASWFQFQQSRDVEAEAQTRFAIEQQDLIYRTADSYLGILEAQDKLSAAIAERDAVKRQLEQVQQRFDVGLVAITDVLESTAAFDSSTVSVIEAEGAQGITFETLLRLTGKNYTSVNGLADDFPVKMPEPSTEDAWVKAALAGNLSITNAEEAVSAAQRGLEVAKSGHAPTVNAELSYGESGSNQQSLLSGKTKATTATLALNVPIFSGMATHSKSKQAGYQLEAAQRNLDLARRTVVENARSLYTSLATDVARVKARLKGIESSQSALDATQTGYEVGTRNIVDVLLAQQRLYQAQFQYASARYQYIRDTLKLKQVVGTLSPDDIYQLNKYLIASKTVGKIKPTATAN